MDEYLTEEELLLDSKSLSSGISYQYIYTVLQFGTGILFYLYFIRFYSPYIVGFVVMIQALNVLLPIIFTAGLPAGLQHYIASYIGERRSDRAIGLVKGYLYISLLLSAAALLFTIGFSPGISWIFFHTDKYIYFISFLAVSIAISIPVSMINGMLLGLGRFREGAEIYIVGIPLSYITSVLLFIVTGSIYSLIAGFMIGNIAGLGIALYHIARYTGGAVKRDAAKALEFTKIGRYSVPLFLSMLVGYGAGYVDRFIVAYFINLSDMGIYNLALLVGTSLTILAAPVSNILITKISSSFGKKDNESIKNAVRISSDLLSFVFVPASLGVAALSPMIVILVGGKSYLPAALPLMIISIVIAMFIISSVFTAALYGIRKTKIFVISSSFSLLSNLLLSIVFIPRFGIVGASMSFSSTYFVVFAVQLYFMKKYEVLNVNIRALAKIWFSGLVMFTAILVLSRFLNSIIFLLPLILAGMLIYIGLARSTGALAEDETELLITIVPEKLEFVKGLLKIILMPGSQRDGSDSMEP